MLFTISSGYSQNAKKSETVTLNGSDIYYEVYGTGEPLFLLHGFTRSSMSWLPYVSAFENDFEVYLVDLKGHGKSGHFEEKISVKSAAADVEQLIKYLGLDQIYAIGYSYGGDVLFQLALLRPELIKSMVVVGAYGTWDAKDFPEFTEYLSWKNINNLPWMREQQTGEIQIKKILEQVPNYSVRLNEDEMKSISAKTLLVIGDNDNSVNWDEILKTKKHLPDASLWVVPDMGHGAHRDHNKDNFTKISKEFFSQVPLSASSQAEKNMYSVRKAANAVNQRDFKTVSHYFTENFIRHDLTDAFPSEKKGSGEVINFLQELIKAFPDIQFNIQDIFSDGDKVVVHFRFTGTHLGELFGLTATNNKVNFNGINLYRFENGKIAEVWQLWDWSGVLRQIGSFNIEKPGKNYTLGIWKVKPEKEKDFIKEWTNFASWTGRNINGSGKAHLLQDKENPLRFISFGSWDSEESITHWRNYKEFKTFVEKVKELCDEFQPNTLNEVSSSE